MSEWTLIIGYRTGAIYDEVDRCHLSFGESTSTSMLFALILSLQILRRWIYACISSKLSTQTSVHFKL